MSEVIAFEAEITSAKINKTGAGCVVFIVEVPEVYLEQALTVMRHVPAVWTFGLTDPRSQQ